jgi:hypothetical protein
MQHCKNTLSQGTGYPRWVSSKKSKASSWVATLFGSAPFPQRKQDCRCTMNDAVGGLVRAAIGLPSPPQSHTLEDYVHFCNCNVGIAWAPYAHIANVSFVNGIVPWSNWQVALGWLSLKQNVDDSSLLADILPRAVWHGGQPENLPPRGIHEF